MAKTASTSSARDYLAERVRTLVGNNPHVTERMMFGSHAFLLNGHILVGCRKDGSILLSVGKAFNDEALSRPGAAPMIMRGKPMAGFVTVEPDAIEDEDSLADWLAAAQRWVSTLPRKHD